MRCSPGDSFRGDGLHSDSAGVSRNRDAVVVGPGRDGRRRRGRRAEAEVDPRPAALQRVREARHRRTGSGARRETEEPVAQRPHPRRRRPTRPRRAAPAATRHVIHAADARLGGAASARASPVDGRVGGRGAVAGVDRAAGGRARPPRQALGVLRRAVGGAERRAVGRRHSAVRGDAVGGGAVRDAEGLRRRATGQPDARRSHAARPRPPRPREDPAPSRALPPTER